MDHIGSNTSTSFAYSQFYIYILFLDGYVLGTFTSIGSGIYGGFTLHILRYIHTEVSFLIGLENFCLSLFRLHPYR